MSSPAQIQSLNKFIDEVSTTKESMRTSSSVVPWNTVTIGLIEDLAAYTRELQLGMTKLELRVEAIDRRYLQHVRDWDNRE